MPLNTTLLYYLEADALTPSQQRVERAKQRVLALWSERIGDVLTTVQYHDLFYRSCVLLDDAGVHMGGVAPMALDLLHLADANREAV